MKKLITLNYNGFDVIANNDAWFNATQMASVFGKRPIDWLKLSETSKYLNALCKKNEVKNNHFVKTIKGGNTAKQGTWLHRKLAVRFAQWLDIDFAIWCDEQIESIVSGGKEWTDCRAESKLGYQIMSEIVKVTRDAEGKDTKHYHYSNEALLCNWALTGEWKPLQRNTLTKQDLKLLISLETRNTAYIARGMSQPERKAKLRELVASRQMKLADNSITLGVNV